jgi:hypothetical protein
MSDEQAAFVSALQLTAHRMLCEMQIMFGSRLNDTALLSPLAMDSNIISPTLKTRFEGTMEEINEMQQELKESTVTDGGSTGTGNDQGDNSLLAWELRNKVDDNLVSICKTAFFDTNNKRQAALALIHFVDSGEATTEVVKYLAANMKRYQPVRFLEVQMQALRACFAKNVLTDAHDNEDEMSEGYDKLVQLARRLSQTFGVTKKITEPVLTKSFNRFMQEGVRFSLSEPRTLTFLDAMKPYLKLLGRTDVKALGEHFSQIANQFSDETREMMDEEEAEKPELRSLEWGAFFEFRVDLGKVSGSKQSNWPVSAIKSDKSDASPMPSIDDLDATTRRKLSMSAARSSLSSSRSRLSRSSFQEDEDDGAGEQTQTQASSGSKSQTDGWIDRRTPNKTVNTFGRSSEEKRRARTASAEKQQRSYGSSSSSKPRTGSSSKKRNSPYGEDIGFEKDSSKRLVTSLDDSESDDDSDRESPNKRRKSR